MHKNIQIGSDTELIFRVKDSESGNRIKIRRTDTDYWTYPLKGIRLNLMSPEKKILAKFAIDISQNNSTSIPDNYNPIIIDNWDDGIFSIKVNKKLSSGFPVGSFFAVTDFLLDTDLYGDNEMIYTVNDFPLYVGEITANEYE